MAKKEVKSPSIVVHESMPNGQHRIVIHNGGVPVVGSWTEFHQLATNGALLANSGHFEALPLGIFSVRVVPHQQLV